MTKEEKRMSDGRFMRIKQWRADKLDDCFAAMVNRAKEMNLAVDLNKSLLYSPELGRNMSLQEFQSLMRHDLKEHFEGLPCKDRNAMIKSMWDGFIIASKNVALEGSHPHLVTDLETLNAACEPTPEPRRQEDIVSGHGVLQCHAPDCQAGMPS